MPPSLKYSREITGDNGWLSPDGKFYDFNRQDSYSYKDSESGKTRLMLTHADLAVRLGFDTEWEIERRGWIKRSRGEFVTPMKYPTQSQVDVIFDFCQKNNLPMPEWAKVENPMHFKRNPDSDPIILRPGDQFELTEEFEIYIHDEKQHESKIHRKDTVIIASDGDIVRFDKISGKTKFGRNIFQFTLFKTNGTSHRFDMFEPQVQKILMSSVKLGK